MYLGTEGKAYRTAPLQLSGKHRQKKNKKSHSLECNAVTESSEAIFMALPPIIRIIPIRTAPKGSTTSPPSK